jgi:ABC-2 type transport system permease protein
MRSLTEEFKSGTFELLKTLPLKAYQIIGGKFLGALLIVICALLPTIIYAISIQQLSSVGGIDIGATIGSYFGLIFLGAVYTAVGICASSFSNNIVVAFIAGAFVCFLLFSGFDAISKLPIFKAGADYYIELLGINTHYRSISRGVVDVRDIIYFIGLIAFSLFITQKNILNK